ncbi:MAG: hypothetical protein ABI664_14860 [bacterium]
MTVVRAGVRVAAFAVALCVGGQRLSAQHDMASMPTPMPRVGATMISGTSWIPERSQSMRAFLWQENAWTLSAHGAASLTYDEQRTKRGDRQIGLIDWEMFMAARRVGSGRVELRAMTSLEPAVLGGNGYPELLQTGGTFRHAVIHDRQHPHAAITELAVLIDQPVIPGTALFVYAGMAGDPAAGPTPYMHRPSAEYDPLAPLGHHWQDASHGSFGVVTVGAHTSTVQLEGSAFNAREADETHPVVDLRDAKLDSYSGRLSWAPASRFVVSSWWAYLSSHERLDTSTRMHRYGASLMSAQSLGGERRLSSTVIWGMNVHHHSGSSHLVLHGGPDASPHHHSSSLLAETNLGLGGGGEVFARAERVQKSGEELGFLGGDLTELYDIRTVSGGAAKRIASGFASDLLFGARAAVNVVPASLLATYGTRTPFGLVVYLQLRPGTAGHGMAGAPAPGNQH